MLYVVLYLVAIVLANISVAIFGSQTAIITAFLFIGLDLTARDKLHEAWHKKGLVWKMGLLIFFGSILSWALNHGAGRIAVASFLAFACAGIVDTFVFQKLIKHSSWIRINGSNVPSALVDSIVFPGVAFGFPLMYGIMIGQFIAKVIGGFLWSLVLTKSKIATIK